MTTYAPDLSFERPRTSRAGSIALIALAHVGLAYAFGSGLMHKVVSVAPQQAVTVYLPSSPAPHPAPAKTVAVKVELTRPPVIDVTELMPALVTVASPPAQTQAAPVATIAAVAPSAPSAPSQPKTISSDVEFVQAPLPQYPALSRRMNEEGKVLLRVLVSENGRPEQVEVQKSSGSPRLDEAARQAAMRAVFKPYMEGGRPVSVFAMVPITFKLG